MPRIKHVKFQNLLNDKFIITEQHRARDVARRMNIPESSLYHYIEGASAFPIDLLPLLYNATRDPEFITFATDDTDMMLVSRQEGNGLRSLLSETLDGAAAVGLLVAVIQEALEDNHLSEAERSKINKAVNKAQKELEDIKAKVKR